MKRPIQFLTASIALAFTAAAHADLKVATVDVKQVFSNYYKTQKADADMNVTRNEVKRDIDELTEKLKAMDAEMAKDVEELKKPEISDAKKAPIAKALEKKRTDFQAQYKSRQEYIENKGKQLEAHIARVRKGIVDDITAVVTDKAKEANYDFVFDVSGMSGSNLPVVLFSKSDFDITKSVIEKLNANKPAGGAADKPAEPSALSLDSKPAEKAAEAPVKPAPTPKKK